jgi:hypothetical protein
MANLNWNTRLVVSVAEGAGGTHVDVTPIQTFTPTFTLNAAPIHSLEQSHVGVSYSPAALTFTLTVSAIDSSAAKLTAIAMAGTRFDIVMQARDGEDWSFERVVMSKCVITSAAPSAATTTAAPTATFSGFSLEATVTPKPGFAAEVTVPKR